MHDASRVPARLEPALVGLLAALAALGPFSIDLYLPAFGAIADDLRTGPDRVQVTLSAYFVGLALGQLVAGPLSDRFGRRPPLLAGLALYTVASLGCAWAATVEQLIAWRALQAVGACTGTVASRAVLRDRFEPRDMARALSMVILVMGLAPILAPLVGAAVHDALGWRALFVGLGVYGVAVFTAVAVGLDETLKVPSRRTPSEVLTTFVEVLRLPVFLGYALTSSFAQAAMFVYIASSSFVFTRVFGLTPTGFAVLFGTNAFGLIVASQLNERWLRRSTPEAVLARVISVQVVASVLLLASAWTGVGGVVGVAVPLFVVVAGLGFVLPNATAVAMAPVADRAGLAAAALGTLQYGTAGAATFLAAARFDGSARPMALGVAVFMAAAAVVRARVASTAADDG